MGIQLFLPRRVKYWKPLVYAEIPGRNIPGGPQLAGHQIAVTLPQDPSQFDPDEHIRDLGPLPTGHGQAEAPYLILPGLGEVDQSELAELSQAIRERNAKRAREGSAVNDQRLARSPERFNAAFRDHLDRVLRAKRGVVTTGPGSRPRR